MANRKILVLLNSLNVEDILKKDNELNDIPQKFSAFNSIVQLITLIMLLIVIILAAYFVTRLISGVKVNQLQSINFKVIDTYNLGGNKAMQIIKVGSRYIVIAINKENINFLMELDEEDIKIKEDANNNFDFLDILNKMKNKKNNNLKGQ